MFVSQANVKLPIPFALGPFCFRQPLLKTISTPSKMKWGRTKNQKVPKTFIFESVLRTIPLPPRVASRFAEQIFIATRPAKAVPPVPSQNPKFRSADCTGGFCNSGLAILGRRKKRAREISQTKYPTILRRPIFEVYIFGDVNSAQYWNFLSQS